MTRKQRSRITVEYMGNVEYCGSREKALERFDELTAKKPCRMHVRVRENGRIIAECIPLIVDGKPVYFD